MCLYVCDIPIYLDYTTLHIYLYLYLSCYQSNSFTYYIHISIFIFINILSITVLTQKQPLILTVHRPHVYLIVSRSSRLSTCIYPSGPQTPNHRFHYIDTSHIPFSYTYDTRVTYPPDSIHCLTVRKEGTSCKTRIDP